MLAIKLLALFHCIINSNPELLVISFLQIYTNISYIQSHYLKVLYLIITIFNLVPQSVKSIVSYTNFSFQVKSILFLVLFLDLLFYLIKPKPTN
jgi:hypothetical protein